MSNFSHKLLIKRHLFSCSALTQYTDSENTVKKRTSIIMSILSVSTVMRPENIAPGICIINSIRHDRMKADISTIRTNYWII